MFTTRQTAEIIDKFIDLTQVKKMTWASVEPQRSMTSPDSRVEIVYVSTHLNRNIRVYKQHYKFYFDEEKFTWDEKIVVEFIDGNGHSLGELPRTPNANQLLTAIQFQNPSINTFYNDLFDEL